MECGACWIPRSSRIDTLEAAASRRATARTRSSASPARRQYSRDGHALQLLEQDVAVACVRRQELVVQQTLLGPGRRAARRGRRRPCPAAPAGGSPPARRSWCGAGRSRSARGRGPWRSPSGRRACAGTRANARGSCPRTSLPRRARSPESCGSAGGRTAARRPTTRPSSPGPGRSTCSARRTRRASRPQRLPRGGCPGRLRRSRRSTRPRARRGSHRAGRRPPGRRCPSRSPRMCRRGGGAAARVSRSRAFW